MILSPTYFRPSRVLHLIPAMLGALGVLIGILIGFATHLHAPLIILIPGIALAGIACKKKPIISLILFIVAGFLATLSWENTMRKGDRVFVSGDTISLKVRFCAPPIRFQKNKAIQRVQCSESTYQFKATLPEALHPGETATLSAIYEEYPKKNPAPWQYNEASQERIRNSIGILTVIEMEKIVVSKHIYATNQYIRRHFETARNGSFFISLFIGDRSGITPHIQSLFSESGLIHFLAISGLHLGLLIGTITWILKFVPLPLCTKRIIAVLCISMLPALCGAGPATIRAITMGSLLLLAPVFDRKSNGINTLAIALITYLLFNPSHIYLVGFQYSFIATTAILIAPKLIPEGRAKPFLLILFIPVLMFFVTTPIQLTHFGTLTTASIPANLIMLPLLVILYQIAFASLLIPIPIISAVILQIADAFADFIFFILERSLIMSNLGENASTLPVELFIIPIVIICICRAFEKHREIACVYCLLIFLTIQTAIPLCTHPQIYVMQDKEFGLILAENKVLTLGISGENIERHFQSPSFIRWLHKKLHPRNFYPNDHANVIIAVKDDKILPRPIRNFTAHISHVRSTSGEMSYQQKDHITRPLLSTAGSKSSEDETNATFVQYKVH